MAFDLSIFNGHMDRVISDMPVTFMWENLPYQGVKTTPDFTQELEIGGIDQKIQFNLFVKADSFNAVFPKEGDIFVIDGIRMKVIEVRKSPDSGQVLNFQMAFARRSLNGL